MDIFTTVLTKVRTTPIKPEKLRVKSLVKDTATREIDEDSGQLEEYAFYKISEKQAKQNKNKNQDDKQDKKAGGDQQSKADNELEIVPEEPTILHKQDITQPKKETSNVKDDKDVDHLDIYV